MEEIPWNTSDSRVNESLMRIHVGESDRCHGKLPRTAAAKTESIVMKILIISDIHGNFDALAALQETYDELWVLGDLVNYGPDPAAVIDFVRSKAAVVVCGNHDYSIGFNQDPRCSARFREMAEATRRYTNSVLSFGHKHFLRHLPPSVETRAQRRPGSTSAMRFLRIPSTAIARPSLRAGSLKLKASMPISSLWAILTFRPYSRSVPAKWLILEAWGSQKQAVPRRVMQFGRMARSSLNPILTLLNRPWRKCKLFRFKTPYEMSSARSCGPEKSHL